MGGGGGGRGGEGEGRASWVAQNEITIGTVKTQKKESLPQAIYTRLVSLFRLDLILEENQHCLSKIILEIKHPLPPISPSFSPCTPQIRISQTFEPTFVSTLRIIFKKLF